MKTLLRRLMIIAAIAAAATVHGASVPGLDVTVKKHGKAVYHGKTDAAGNFSTANLEPGAYSVEVRSPKTVNLKGQQLSISVTAGKEKPRQSNADGSHLQAGVAMTVDVSRPAKLNGKVNSTGRVAAEKTGTVPAGYERVKANVKVINGKRYVWVPGAIGSNMGGKWVEEGSDEAALSTSNKKGGDGQVLQHIQDQSSNIGRRGG
ncbi:MAG: carboxypeptidase-like regulatory domain-containing protein [Verrucomicrobiota bacterium]|nr:carboxypeptidase-like regulatory domain-containing protein [Verrucomicrobiota bacterium]